ncbi:MAG TPA: hypothetical protein PLR92_01925 [Alicycliphilus denitrificans]|nr:hypothetical protein [Alicycliphilus denitrificans]
MRFLAIIALIVAVVVSSWIYIDREDDVGLRQVGVKDFALSKRYGVSGFSLAGVVGGDNEKFHVNKDYKYILQQIESLQNSVRLTDDRRAQLRDEIFYYSRKANDDFTKPLLKMAWEKGLISEKEYYGEVAHMLSDNLEDPKSIIMEIVAAKNSYGMEVMFMTIQEAPWREGLARQDRDEIFAALEKSKPVFTTEMSVISMSDIYRYENWLKALELFYTGADYMDHLDRIIVSKADEPREFFAVIYGGYYKKLLAHGKFESIARMNRVVADYQRSYPENSISEMIVQKM